MKHLRYIRIFSLSIVLTICLAGCGRRSPDNLAGFSKALFESARQNDIETIVGQYCMNMADSKRYLEDIVKKFPGVPAKMNQDVTDELIAQSHRNAFRIFRNSYEDLLQGEAVSFSARKNQLGSYTLIIWVKQEKKYKGILIQSVILTESGYKVNDWLGAISVPYKKPSSLSKKRAVLVAHNKEECTFPKSGITYECEFTN